MIFPITGLFAGIFAIALVPLTVMVGAYRARSGVSLLDGGNPTLTRLMRAHGNFVEYVPISLVTLGMAEANGAPAPMLWSLCAILLAGRALHAVTLIVSPDAITRAIAMIATLSAPATAGGWLLWALTMAG